MSSSTEFSGFNHYDIDRFDQYLKAYWSLDEPVGQERVDLVGGNDLSDIGTVGSFPGKKNNAARFISSNQEVLVKENSSIDLKPSTGLAVSLWARFDSSSKIGRAHV